MTKRLLAWDAGEKPGPFEIWIFPTNRCNLKCAICWQRWAEKEFGGVDYKSEISDERLLDLIDEGAALGVHTWRIVGGGEPMIRGDLVIRLCERIRQLGMNGYIQSNGTKFTRDQIEALIRIGWEHVTFSLDGPSAEINDSIRSSHSFEKATRNLGIFRDLKRQYNSTYPLISLCSVVTTRNADHLEEMVALACEYDCDSLEPISLVVLGEYTEQLRLTDEQQQHLQDNITGARQMGQACGVRVASYVSEFPMNNWPQCAPIVSRNPDAIENAVCFEPWLSMTILAENGMCGPCSPFWDRESDSIRNMTLKEVWEGPYMQDVRRRLLRHENFPSYCKNCCSHIPEKARYFRERILEAKFRQYPPWKRLYNIFQRQGIREVVRKLYEWVATRPIFRK